MTVNSIPELALVASRVRQEYLDYDKLTQIKEEIDLLRYRDNAASEGGVMAIVGQPGSGKTKLIIDYMSGVKVEPKAIRTEDGGWADRCEVLDFRIKEASAKNVLELMYRKMTGVDADLRRFDISNKVEKFAKEMETRLMIFDESHQAIDDKTDKVAKDLARLFKDLSNQGQFSVALVGTPEDVERLILANDELERRTLVYKELCPLRWDVPGEQAIFVDILHLYDEYFAEVFGQLSGFADENTALRIHVASLGLIGLAAKLVERAAIQAGRQMLAGRASGDALLREPARVGWEHLEEAFTYRKKNDGRPNPFRFPPGTAVAHDIILPTGQGKLARKFPRGESEALFVKR